MKYKILVIILGISFLAASCNKNNSNQARSDQVTSQQVAPSPAPSDAPPPAPVPNPTPVPKPTPTPAPNPSPVPTPTPVPVPTPTPPPTKSFSVTADDYTATPSTITVNKGDIVKLTLNVSTTNVYYGGLDFRSSVVNSGAISPGASKLVTFTANSSFTIHCYWPQSGVQKQSQISVVVN